MSQTKPYYKQLVTLLDGRKAAIRPICVEDKSQVKAFHNRLSDETRFLRYHYCKGGLTEDDLKAYCEIDYYNDMALVAEIVHEEGSGIIGVGRFCRLPNFNTAEIAFVVQDGEQRKGVGTQLLKHLALLAWERNIRYFHTEVLRHNRRMLSIFRKSDPDLNEEVDSSSTCIVTMSVLATINNTP